MTEDLEALLEGSLASSHGAIDDAARRLAARVPRTGTPAQRLEQLVQGATLNAALTAGGSLVVGALGGAYLMHALMLRDRPEDAPGPAPREEVPPAPPRRVDTPPARPVAVVWAGPANLAQVGPATLPGVRTVFKPCTGDGSPSCAAIADGWRDKDGRRLPGLRKALGLPEGPIALAAFSAGGHLVRRLLEHPADRAEVLAVALADATYTTTWADPKTRKAAPIEAFVSYAREAGAAGRIFVATASSAPNKQHPNGAEVLAAIAEAAGASRIAGEGELPVSVRGLPGARRGWALPGATFLDYGAAFGHDAHATKLAREVWARLVNPHFGGTA